MNGSRRSVTSPRRRRCHPSGDTGITLIEVVVSMALMSIFMIMFTTVVVQLYYSVSNTEANSAAQSNLNIAFTRLDRQVRYAAGISEPVEVGSTWYVEYLVSYTGAAVCNQLRLKKVTGQRNYQLQWREWDEAGSPGAAWTPLASDVSLRRTGQQTVDPFAVFAPEADPGNASAPPGGYSFQRLRLQFVVNFGSGRTMADTEVDIGFTALNASGSPGGATSCAVGRL